MSTLKVTNIQATGETATRIVAGVSNAFANFNMVSVGIQDSTNISTLTDNGSGDFTLTATSNFGNNQYTTSGNLGHTNVTNGWGIIENTNTTRSTSATRFFSYGGDFYVNNVVYHGDLA